MAARYTRTLGSTERIEHLHSHRRERIGVVVDLDRPHVSLLLVPVQAVDVELRAFMQVDRLLVEQHRGGELVHLADDLRSRMRRVDDHDVVGQDPAQVHLFGRESLPAPEPPPGGPRGGAVLLEQLQQLADVGASQSFLLLERQLEKAGLQMTREEQQVVRVDQAFLRIGAEEVLGVADDELVER